MPCSISDDAYNDYSDFIENEGVYRTKPQPSPDDEHDYCDGCDTILNYNEGDLCCWCENRLEAEAEIERIRDAMLDKQFTISLGIAPLTANRGSD